jgi:drug/metabolite transporter (DMT)-like permease
VEFNGAAVATVLAFSSPAMTAILAHYLLREEINGIKLGSIGLSLIGTVLVSGAADPAAWKVNAAGIAFGLLTGLFFACYNMSANVGQRPLIRGQRSSGFTSAVVVCSCSMWPESFRAS